MANPIDTQANGWLAAVLRSIADGVIATDAEARVAFMNRAAEELTGWTEAEARGEPVADVLQLVDEETGRREAWPVREALAQGRPVTIPDSTVLVSRSGQRFNLSDVASPVYDERGGLTGAVIVFRDVTERRQAQHALSASERRFISFADAAPAMLWVTEPDGSCSFLSQGWYEFTGQGEAEGLGFGWLDAVHPEDREEAGRVFVESNARREMFRCEYRFRRADGAYRWGIDIGRPRFSPEGEYLGYVGSVIDIDDRKRAEDRLRESEAEAKQSLALLYELVEQCPFGIYIVDADFRIATINRGSQDGAFANVRPVIGRPFDEAMRILWPEPVAADVIRTFRHTLATGEPYSSKDFVNPRADTDQVEGYEWELHRVTLPDGRPGVACYYFDATRLREAEAALRENDRRKDEFLAMLAHELRNPLAAVGNAATVLKMSSDPENVAFAKDIIERQTRQLARLIDDLLDVSRIQSGKIRLRRELCDAGTILRQAVESVEPLIRERKHRLVTEFEEGTLPLRADATRVEQIAVNLLTNAAKYSENGGRIRLVGEQRGDQVVISVEDEGIGIPPEKLPQMFELFAQGERSIARSEGGLGIGLTIVQKLAEMHGGSVSAHSDGQGKGSTFVVRLPSAPRPASQPAGPRVVAATERRGSRILVVDDNVDTARGLVRLLKLLGNEVEAAHDGVSAIDAARAFKPEFVLLDIGLPGMDGFEVARRLREESGCQASVIIAVSGYGQEEDRRRSREAGFDHHLVKPVDFDRLVSLLTHAI